MFVVTLGFILLHSWASVPQASCTKILSPTTDFAGLVNGLSAGDVACLHAGTYSALGTTNSWTKSGSSTAPITVEAAPGATVLVKGYTWLNASYINVYGLTFDGPTGNVNVSNTPNGEQDVLALAGNNIVLDHSEVRNGLWNAGIFSSGSNITIQHSYIHDNGSWNNPSEQHPGGAASNLDQGIYVGEGSNIKILNNVISHNLAQGLQIYPSPTNVLVANNTIVNNGTWSVSGHGAGIVEEGSSSSVTIINNIIANNDGYDIHTAGSLSGSGNTASYNISWHNTAGVWNDSSGISLGNNLNVDPKFVSATDFHLQLGSPAIDAGTSTNAPNTDYADTSRPQGSGYDIGAYEYLSSTGSPDTTPPIVSITAPAQNATLSGTVRVSASASDNTGVTKIEFYLDNTLQQSGIATTYSWDTTTASNAGHTLLVKAYDAAGSVGSSNSLAVTVSNAPPLAPSADTTAPSTPTKLTAVLIQGGHSIKLSWQASTDNVGVAGYYIWRNGVKIVATTSNPYSDYATDPRVKYTYYVVAFDAAGNLSQPSSSVILTTRK